LKPGIGSSMLLWEFAEVADEAGLARRIEPLTRYGLCRATESDQVCTYAEPSKLATMSAVLPANALLSTLTCVQDIAGASAGSPAPWHYVVDTDVLPEAEADLNAWYLEEHLPGLASVPGTVWAGRFVREGATGPRYRACYDLVSLETFGSPPWLAVRATAWSSRVRPSFRNTRRMMFKRVVTDQ
jgi:hypothetical protein